MAIIIFNRIEDRKENTRQQNLYIQDIRIKFRKRLNRKANLSTHGFMHCVCVVEYNVSDESE